MQRWVPNVCVENVAIFLGVVPSLVIEAVVEDRGLADLPTPFFRAHPDPGAVRGDLEPEVSHLSMD